MYLSTQLLTNRNGWIFSTKAIRPKCPIILKFGNHLLQKICQKFYLWFYLLAFSNITSTITTKYKLK